MRWMNWFELDGQDGRWPPRCGHHLKAIKTPADDWHHVQICEALHSRRRELIAAIRQPFNPSGRSRRRRRRRGAGSELQPKRAFRGVRDFARGRLDMPTC